MDHEPDILAADNTSTESNADIPTKNSLSESQSLLADFNPLPYIFLLKDATGKDVTLSPERITNARIECPKYHILLDHLMAVLWCFYSNKNLDLLQSNQIHWALKILEGTKNNFGTYTEDVQMAIDNLTDAYMNICSRFDISNLRPSPDNKKISTSPSNLLRTPEGYDNFWQEVPNTGLMNTSIHLTDLIGEQSPEKIKELCPGQWQQGDDGPKLTDGSDFRGRADAEFTEPCSLAISALIDKLNLPQAEDAQNEKDMRDEKIREMTNMLDELKKLVDNLQNSPLERTNEIRKLLENCLERKDEI